MDRALGSVAPPRVFANEPAAGPMASPLDVARHEVVLVARARAQQSELRVGRVGVARATTDYHALVVANAVLGGQFSSRINLNLREQKGFTYGARSYFDFRRGAEVPSSFRRACRRTRPPPRCTRSSPRWRACGGHGPPTARELELARQGLTRGYARNFETAEQIARGMVQLSLHRLPDDTFDSFIERARAVTAEAVTDVAQRHFAPDDMLAVVVGDEAQVAPTLDGLGIPWRVASPQS